MYVVDFFKSLFKKHRIPVIVYLILNVLLISVIVHYFIASYNSAPEGYEQVVVPYWQSLLISIALYLVSVAIALSPIGEFILRYQNGCHKISRVEQVEKLDPIFKDVYSRAKQKNPELSDNIQLFINDSKAPNAFATGRNTICLTNGMLKVSPNELKGVLAHEFAHIANKDTDLILVITVGNMIVTALIILIRIIITILSLIISLFSIFGGGREGAASGIAALFGGALANAVIGILMYIWTKFGQLLVLKGSRSSEYLADEYSYYLGFGDGICTFLDKYDKSKAEGLFAILSSSHPRKDDRIAHLQQLGCTYRG